MSTTRTNPHIIQGGMGVGVSSWRLANAVARHGALGVVSGSMLDTVIVRRLQDGDPADTFDEPRAHFPLPGAATRFCAATIARKADALARRTWRCRCTSDR